MRLLFCFLSLILLSACQSGAGPKLQPGIWRATLPTKDSLILPFNFEVKNDNVLTVFNADEIIAVDEVTYFKDSVQIKFPVFDGYIEAKLKSNKVLSGWYKKDELQRYVPFKAVYGNALRFETEELAQENVSGIWETTFSPSLEDESKAKGIFKQEGNKVTGTFRTTTGDYRYLEGVVDGKTLKLSAFDGSHAYLFVAEVTDSTMFGTFYSGNHYKEPFVAKRNSDFELADADSLTFLKPGFDKLEFSFPDGNGTMVSLADEQFKNKVVVVQLMGTWCPNCLDETRYFSEYLKANPSTDLAFVALAFEYTKTEDAAFKNIERLQKRLGISYPVLLAQQGTTSKTEAQEKLPMLNHVLSYPTAIYIDKNGVVRKIHTGFNGPATGELYDTYKREFEAFITKLLNE